MVGGLAEVEKVATWFQGWLARCTRSRGWAWGLGGVWDLVGLGGFHSLWFSITVCRYGLYHRKSLDKLKTTTNQKQPRNKTFIFGAGGRCPPTKIEKYENLKSTTRLLD